jgi:hypothetical protein
MRESPPVTGAGDDAMTEKKFEGVLTARGPKGAWTYMPIPFSVEEVFGVKSRLPVAGTINGFPFRNSLMPNGDGTHLMTISKELMAGAKAEQGERVQVTMKLDDAPREVELPAELAEALKGDKQAAAIFATLAPSHKKEFTDWIAGAKKAETRVSRAAKAVEMIRKKERRP